MVWEKGGDTLIFAYYNDLLKCDDLFNMSRVRSSIAFSLNSKISFKIIVVGDRGVGKTSLIVRYVKGTFDKNYNVTVGV